MDVVTEIAYGFSKMTGMPASLEVAAYLEEDGVHLAVRAPVPNAPWREVPLTSPLQYVSPMDVLKADRS